MTISVDSEQLKIAERADVAAFPLVIVETFSDVASDTVSKTFYWTRGSGLRYSFNGSDVVRFEPKLVSLSPISRGFNHIPTVSDFSTRDDITLEVDATERAGHYLWAELLSENFHGARVTIASLLVDPADIPEGPIADLSALGAVHTFRWRGEITNIPTIDEEATTFLIVAEATEPALKFRRLTRPLTASDEDLGKRYPIPVGDADGMRTLKIDVGKSSNLAVPISDTYTGLVFLDDTSGFFVTTGVQTAFLGEEIVVYNGIDQGQNAIAVTNRGELGTTASAHEAGILVQDSEPYLRFLVSEDPIYGVRAVYVRSALGELVRIPDSENWGLNNTSFLDPGKYVAVVMIDAAAIAKAYGGFNVNQQAFIGFANGENIEVFADVEGVYEVSGPEETIIDLVGDEGNWTAVSRPADIFESVTANTGGDGITLSANPGNAGSAIFVRDLPFRVGGYADGEFEFTFETDSGSYDSIAHISFELNTQADPVAYQDTPFSTCIAVELAAAVNYSPLIRRTARICSRNIRSGRNPAEISQIRIYITRRNSLQTTLSVDLVGEVKFTPIQKVNNDPLDVVSRYITEVAGFPASAVDAPSFAAAAANITNTKFNGDLSALGSSFGETIARFGYESRTNFVWSSNQSDGSVAMKAFNALPATLSFGPPIRELKTLKNLATTSKPLTEIVNQFEFLFRARPGFDLSDAESYSGALIADETRNDFEIRVANSLFTDSQANFGVRPAETAISTLLADSTSVVDVFSYYVNEALRASALRFSAVVPWWDGYDLEPGDIVSIQPRWAPAPFKCRVIRTVFDFDSNGLGVNLEEVL